MSVFGQSPEMEGEVRMLRRTEALVKKLDSSTRVNDTNPIEAWFNETIRAHGSTDLDKTAYRNLMLHAAVQVDELLRRDQEALLMDLQQTALDTSSITEEDESDSDKTDKDDDESKSPETLAAEAAAARAEAAEAAVVEQKRLDEAEEEPAERAVRWAFAKAELRAAAELFPRLEANGTGVVPADRAKAAVGALLLGGQRERFAFYFDAFASTTNVAIQDQKELPPRVEEGGADAAAPTPPPPTPPSSPPTSPSTEQSAVAAAAAAVSLSQSELRRLVTDEAATEMLTHMYSVRGEALRQLVEGAPLSPFALRRRFLRSRAADPDYEKRKRAKQLKKFVEGHLKDEVETASKMRCVIGWADRSVDDTYITEEELWASVKENWKEMPNIATLLLTAYTNERQAWYATRVSARKATVKSILFLIAISVADYNIILF